MDEIDRRILEKLREDARMPFTEIARDLKMSDPAVHVRVKKMMEREIIQGYTARVDQRALGREVYGFVLINVEPGALKDVAKQLVENKNVDAIYEIHGQNDLSVKIWARDLDEMRELMLRIREVPHVRSTELYTVLKVWKERSI